jgi:hypothetical protein
MKAGTGAVIKMKDEVAEFIMEQDRLHSPSKRVTITKEDALFIIDLALNCAEMTGLLASMDTTTYTSQRIETRFKYLYEYRFRKYDDKDLGPVTSVPFFLELQPEFLEYFMSSNGTTLEQYWLLSGLVEDRVQQYYGLPDQLNEIKLRDPSLNLSIEVGKLYKRVSGFTQKFYKLITKGEKLIDDWFSHTLDYNTNLRKFNNDYVGYYFGDLERAAPGIRDGESEADYYDRTLKLRARWKEKGYIMVKGYKLDKTNPGMYVAKDGTLVEDIRLATTEYKFTPATTYYDFFYQYQHGHDGDHKYYSAEELLKLSVEKPAELQEIMEKRFTTDVFTRMRVEFFKEFIISELTGQVAEAFQKKDFKQKKEFLDAFFALMNQHAFTLKNHFTFSGVTSGATDHGVQLAGFGKLTLDDIEEILVRSEVIMPSPFASIPGSQANLLRRKIDDIRRRVEAVKFSRVGPLRPGKH